jgi:hypothetical protein
MCFTLNWALEWAGSMFQVVVPVSDWVDVVLMGKFLLT